MPLTRTLFEEKGPIMWAALRSLTDEPLVLPKVTATSEGHGISQCITMLNCPRHRNVWRNHSVEYRQAHRKANPLPKRAKAVK